MIEKPKGTNDYIHPESTLRKEITNKITSFLENLGYKPIETPVFENIELFKRSAGITSDIVSKEMYEFQDKKGRHLALRPEITAPVVRAIIQNNLLLNHVIKLYYVGSIFRYEKPQKDRYRQATQFGIEYFGQEDYLADFETILICHHIYNSIFNLQVEVHLNSIGCQECRPSYRESIFEYFSKFEDKLCSDCKRRLNENPLRILDCKNPVCKEISNEAPKSIDHLCTSCKKHFNNLLQTLNDFKIPIKLNTLLVRGLDYYNRTVFEIKCNNVDLAGGGRYDYLVREISQGKYDIPAIGFAGGLERLTNILQEQKTFKSLLKEKIRINLVSLTEKADKIISGIYSKLLEKIVLKKKIDTPDIEIYLTKFENLSKALKASDKLKINYVVFVGEEELNQDEVTIKNMETGKQQRTKIESFIPTLIGLLKDE
ncbi:MAG: histidine--tRNA ligase [bacterium]|nr:histidine--tRNA ligase [bacterium]